MRVCGYDVRMYGSVCQVHMQVVQASQAQADCVGARSVRACVRVCVRLYT